MQYLLFALLMFALTACSGNSNSTTSSSPGAVSAKLVWSADGKSAGKTAALYTPPVGATARFVITGPTIPTAKGAINLGTNTGTVDVYPGNDLIVNAQLLDASGNLLKEGFATGVTVVSGQTTTLASPIQMVDAIIKTADASCLVCHGSSKDITGQNLVASYKQSGHYTNEFAMFPLNGSTQPGCAGCHGTQHQDITPAASGRCYTCHSAALSLRHGAPAVAGVNARYLSLGNNNCSACHEPHNPLYGVGSQERADWAASGHGDINAQPWMEQDFSAAATCNACHTPTGFVQALNSTWANTAAVNTGMQPLTCDACHSNNNFPNSVRQMTTGYAAGMGGFGASAKTTLQYPNVGESNLCIPCHASRENGKSMRIGVSNFANSSFKNPHYLGAAAVFYGLGGFQYYSTATNSQYFAQAYTSKYGVVVDGTIIKTAAASSYPGGVPAIAVGDALVGRKAPWNHGRLGMDNFTTAALSSGNATNIRGSGNKGQCVACHLGPTNVHSFGAFDAAKATWNNNTSGIKGCYGCHNSEDMEEVADNSELILYSRLMDFFKWQLGKVGAYYSDNYPYFYADAAGTTQLKNWTAVTVPGGTGAANMGTAMNYKLLAAEKGAHVHNRTFMKQLIFDSIQYLQNGSNSFSNRNLSNSGKATVNSLISFTNYSSDLAANINGANRTIVNTVESAVGPSTSSFGDASIGVGVVGQPVSVSQLKRYITRYNSGFAAGTQYTRP